VQRLAPVAVALDAPDIDVAAHWATLVTPYVSTVKIGLELYLRYGPAVVATVRGGSGVHVFLDLKLHDIPNTVAAAAHGVAKLRPEVLTVHAAGGADMIKAAVEAAPETIVAGVTLLTSIGDKDLAELGMEGSVSDTVRRMATLAVRAGARGLVCSPQEVAAVRAEVGSDIMLITPGIRPAGATSDDQARIATPVEALNAGADLLVIGRPITKSPDPGAAAATIAASLRRGMLWQCCLRGDAPRGPPGIGESLARSSLAGASPLRRRLRPGCVWRWSGNRRCRCVSGRTPGTLSGWAAAARSSWSCLGSLGFCLSGAGGSHVDAGTCASLRVRP
jgi:orotidine-5'-phosphate decarboxylase